VAAWERLRSEGTTAEQLCAELRQTRFLLREARAQLEILRARMAREPPRHRRHYTSQMSHCPLTLAKRQNVTMADATVAFAQILELLESFRA